MAKIWTASLCCIYKICTHIYNVYSLPPMFCIRVLVYLRSHKRLIWKRFFVGLQKCTLAWCSLRYNGIFHLLTRHIPPSQSLLLMSFRTSDWFSMKCFTSMYLLCKEKTLSQANFIFCKNKSLSIFSEKALMSSRLSLCSNEKEPNHLGSIVTWLILRRTRVEEW